MLGIFGDLHFGVKGGDKFFLAFQVAWMKRKLDTMAAAGIKKLYQVGDSFDNQKSTQSTVQAAMIEVIEYAKVLGIEMIFTVGNHNTFYRDTNAVHNLKVYEQYSNVTIVEEYLEDGNCLLLGWINPSNHDKIMEVVENTKCEYCFMHADFDGFEMYKGIVAKGGMSIVPFRKFKKVFTGHYHTISEDGNVLYVGSPYALTWMDYVDGDNRGWWQFDETTGEYSLLKNLPQDTLFATHEYVPTKDYADFDLVELSNKVVKFFVKEVTDEKKYDQFIKVVNSTPFIDRRVIDEREMKKIEHSTIDIKEMNITPLVVIQNYVEAEAIVNGLDPLLLKQMATDLYLEAASGDVSK